MRLRLVSGEAPEALGGVGDHTLRLAGALAGRGVQVDALVPQGPPLHPAPPFELRRAFERGAAPAALAAACRRGDPDVLLIQYVPWLYQPRGLPHWLLGLFDRLRQPLRPGLLLFGHELWHFGAQRLRDRLRAALQRRLLRGLARRSDALIVTSDARLQAVTRQRLPVAALERVRIGSNLPQQERRPAGDGCFRVASFGRHRFQQRRPDLLAEALARLPVPGGRRALRLIGPLDAEARHWLSGLPPAGVQLERFDALPPGEAARRLGECDAAVCLDCDHLGGLASRSSVAAAALALGVPLVANPGPGTDAIYRDGENVLLCDPEPAALARALATLLDPERARALGAGGRALHEQELAWPRAAQQVEALALAAGRRAGRSL